MKIFRSEQIKEIDRATIKNEPVKSADLMERAAEQLLRWYIKSFDRSRKVIVFAGPGNNGGDGLALARMLSFNRFNVEVYYIRISDKTTEDWSINYTRLEKEAKVPFNIIEAADRLPFISPDDIIIDAIFGSGLKGPSTGLSRQVITKINQSGCVVVSIDIPSGLCGEDNNANDRDGIVCADFTLSFEFPKLSFMFAENARFVGSWNVLPIGLDPRAVRETLTPYYLLDDKYINRMLKVREKFDHKGKYGHGLIIAGSFGKIGAAILGTKAALRTGIGLITCHVPGCGYQIIQTSVPEAMVRVDSNERFLSDTVSVEAYDAVGIGPGIGNEAATQKAFHSLLINSGKPMVIDADGINILGENKEWLSELQPGTILTPHVKEFERIAGETENSYSRLERQIEFAAKYKCIVVLKGAYSSVVTPGGKVFFNSTGNPGMATAGSGDVLTGIILSLLSQGYSAEDASLTGVYLHGLAGDSAAEMLGFESIIASDIIDNIGNAFLKVKSAVKI